MAHPLGGAIGFEFMHRRSAVSTETRGAVRSKDCVALVWGTPDRMGSMADSFSFVSQCVLATQSCVSASVVHACRRCLRLWGFQSETLPCICQTRRFFKLWLRGKHCCFIIVFVLFCLICGIYLPQFYRWGIVPVCVPVGLFCFSKCLTVSE